jgi:hypothetical protein
MELMANLPDDLFHRTAIDFAFLDFAGTPVNDFVPLRFRRRVHRVIQAGDKPADEERAVLFRQGQHFGHFFDSNAHALEISARTDVLASFSELKRVVNRRRLLL